MIVLAARQVAECEGRPEDPMNRKKRRHSGYVTPRATISKKALEQEGLFINPEYDDWNNYRDGMRDWFGDYKKIKKVNWNSRWAELVEKRQRMNEKQKRLLRRRIKRKKCCRFTLSEMHVELCQQALFRESICR